VIKLGISETIEPVLNHGMSAGKQSKTVEVPCEIDAFLPRFISIIGLQMP
jgi:hypothetical protein